MFLVATRLIRRAYLTIIVWSLAMVLLIVLVQHHVVRLDTLPSLSLSHVWHGARPGYTDPTLVHLHHPPIQQGNFTAARSDGNATQPSRLSCSPGKPTNLAFIKVHKSGSTTVANMLARYAVIHGLNVALPDKTPGTNRFNYFKRGQLQAMALGEGQQYNVIFNHMVYNRTALDRLMPPNTFYFAIMREPFSRLLSSLNFYNYQVSPILKRYFGFRPHPDGKEEEEAESDLRRISRTTVKKQLLLAGPELYNSLATDTGLRPTKHMKREEVARHLHKLDRELNLVMVMERLPESLVLLKRRACLTIRDIVHLHLNSAKKVYVQSLPYSVRRDLRVLQQADHTLYDHFYAKFQREVLEEEDKGFGEEVQHFNDVLQQVKTFCGSLTEMDKSPVLEVRRSPWNDYFSLGAGDCQLLGAKELKLQRWLVQRALARRGPMDI